MVYVVSHGQYSDKQIDGIFSEEERVQEFIDYWVKVYHEYGEDGFDNRFGYTGPIITEYVLDEGLPPHANDLPWTVEWAERGNKWLAVVMTAETPNYRVMRWGERKGEYGTWAVSLWAPDKESALKSGMEMIMREKALRGK